MWLLIYPLGGALTNDGGARRYRLAAVLVLAIVVFVEFAQFCKAYFIDYVAPSAEAFGYENRDLFVAVRALDPKVACFVGLDTLNAPTLFDFYLRDLHVRTIEYDTRACEAAGAIVAVPSSSDAPPDAELIETIPRYDGTVGYYLYRTQAVPGTKP
ncbi:MAG TPA: hypothetical protein VMF11_02505 [Candidatus Baltobacteraceae bacterium]|nr:hypothetical protein [Candidatus Baltobacteraceae bacterium]